MREGEPVENAATLAGHLKQTWDPNGWWADVSGHAETAAREILRNPQAHIDALVEAGVLADIGQPRYASQNRTAYIVVQPHKHEPEAWVAADSGDTVVGCKGCNTMVKVEWPE